MKNIYFSDETVDIGKENIAIVELSEKVTFSAAVQPACVRWHKTGINLKSGTTGMVKVLLLFVIFFQFTLLIIQY